MDTRVLTLFDDEDFFSQEETPKKPAKKAVKGKDSELVTDTDDAALFPEVAVGGSALPATEQENTNGAAGPALPEAIVYEAPIPGTVMPEADAEAPEIIEEPIAEPPETRVAEAHPEEDELEKHLLQELIQQDYASLIHKDYPFDIQQASVVKKTKETKPAEAEAVPEEEEMAQEDEVFEEVVPLPEWNLDKKYYTIGEVALLFSVNTSHIRFWTNEFKLKPRTTRKGDRLYSPKDIAELRLIHHLVKEKKHTIKGAREKLKTGKTGVNHKLDLKESLTSLKDMLIRIKDQL